MKKYLFICLLMAACNQPEPCPPFCQNPRPTALKTALPSATQTPGPTLTATPTPVFQGTPMPVPEKATEGKAVMRFDLTGFNPSPPLDYYAAAYLLWEELLACKKPEKPALELSIRGLSQEPCLKSPCGPDALGIVARYSANIKYDGTGIPEHDMCGEGINYSRRLPIGSSPIFDVVVSWGPGFVRVEGPTGASWTAAQGADSPGFGVFVEGIVCPPRGIGWAREPWSLQTHGGNASLKAWQALAQGAVGACP